MAYVLTTFFVMGFGYFVAETALLRAVPGVQWAWLGFLLAVIGTLMTVVTVFAGDASVLYTFYPPLAGGPFFYIELVLVVVGSWIWCAIMIVAMAGWKRANPGQTVPLAMFATVANAIMWLWTTIGVAAELLVSGHPSHPRLDANDRCRPVADPVLLDIARDRLFLAVPGLYHILHDGPSGGRGQLYSASMGRLTFIQFLLYSLPVGMHHLFMDPEHSTGRAAGHPGCVDGRDVGGALSGGPGERRAERSGAVRRLPYARRQIPGPIDSPQRCAIGCRAL
jgi:cytochrome c oxidase subunit 1